MVEYYGQHPIGPALGGGLCAIDGPHMHSYRPHDEVLYVNDGPYWTFVGDPTEFEPAAPATYSYYGHHPVWWTHARGEHYCYITGPHRHRQAPRRDLKFVERGGAYWYVDAHPVWYEKRKRKHKMDDHYHRHTIVRPVVAVEPPSGWIGVRLGPRGVSIGVDVRPAAVVPAPAFIHVEEHHYHHPPKHGHYKDHRGKGKHKGHRGKGKRK